MRKTTARRLVSRIMVFQGQLQVCSTFLPLVGQQVTDQAEHVPPAFARGDEQFPAGGEEQEPNPVVVADRTESQERRSSAASSFFAPVGAAEIAGKPKYPPPE